MLTIGQVAAYAATTTRAIRHYHALGLLPEPERNASGYRTYGAQTIVDVKRIRILVDAGVPLKRVAELLQASPTDFKSAVAEIDRDLRTRIRSLQETRTALARLTEAEPFVPPLVDLLHTEMRDLGVSEQTIAMERDGWILAAALFPDLMERWLAVQQAMLGDPEYRDLYLLTDQCYSWDPEDPRIEDLVRRTVAFARTHGTTSGDDWDTDGVAYQLMTSYRMAESPGWQRLMTRLQEEMRTPPSA